MCTFAVRLSPEHIKSTELFSPDFNPMREPLGLSVCMGRETALFGQLRSTVVSPRKKKKSTGLKTVGISVDQRMSATKLHYIGLSKRTKWARGKSIYFTLS